MDDHCPCNYILASINLQFHKLCKRHCGVTFLNNLTPIHNVRITRCDTKKKTDQIPNIPILCLYLNVIKNVIKNPAITSLDNRTYFNLSFAIRTKK